MARCGIRPDGAEWFVADGSLIGRSGENEYEIRAYGLSAVEAKNVTRKLRKLFADDASVRIEKPIRAARAFG
jgi:hypothetical protein